MLRVRKPPVLALFHVPDDARETDLAYATFADGGNRLLALELSEWRGLRCVFEHPEIQLGFFRDTRLTARQVERMADICRECQQALERSGNTGNYAHKQLLVALAVAVHRGHGIIAFCD